LTADVTRWKTRRELKSVNGQVMFHNIRVQYSLLVYNIQLANTQHKMGIANRGTAQLCV